MNTQWELYFLRREIERQKIQKQRKKKRRIWIAGISGLLALVFLAGGISMVRFYRSDYGKLKRAADQYDFRLAAVRMSQYVNEKYGEEVCSSGELSVSPWDPSNLRSYLGFRAESEEDPGKVIYMLYLSKEKVVYLDTFQWEEISEDLMQEAAEKTGIDQVCCDTMQYSSVELSEPYYYCPWVAAGAYMTEYEGNLKQFFTEEVKVRQALPDIEKLGELRINGAFALYFGDSAVPTMRERIQNPNVDYREQFETGLKAIEEKYQIDIASAVLFQRVFLEMKQAVTEKESYSIFPTTWMEYGKGETFFSPAYTLLSLSYDQVFEPKAEKAAEGVYVFSTNGRRRMTGYTCKQQNLQRKSVIWQKKSSRDGSLIRPCCSIGTRITVHRNIRFLMPWQLMQRSCIRIRRSLSSDGIIWTGQCVRRKNRIYIRRTVLQEPPIKWKMSLWYLAIQMDTERKIMGISCIPF